MSATSKDIADFKTVEEISQRILDDQPSSAVRVRLLRDVLARPQSDESLGQAESELKENYWVHLLLDTQDENGNFPRLRSDLRHLGIVEGVHMALAVGLEPDHPILSKASSFAERVLSEGVGNSRPILEVCPFARSVRDSHWELCLAQVLTQLRPDSEMIRPVLSRWLAIIDRGFEGGNYDEYKAKKAHAEVHNEKPDTHISAAIGDAAPLLAHAASDLHPEFEQRYFDWRTQKLQRWLSSLACTATRDTDPASRQAREHTARAAGALRQLMALSPFPSWISPMNEVAERLWTSRDEDGCWDFGRKGMSSGFLTRMMLSGIWRGKRQHKHDWSTWALVLLRKYCDARERNLKAEPEMSRGESKAPQVPQTSSGTAKAIEDSSDSEHSAATSGPDLSCLTVQVTKPRGRVARMLSEMGLKVQLTPEDEGDADLYIISERLAVERRASNSFVNGIMDKSLFANAIFQRERFGLPVLIVEGTVNYEFRGMDPQAVRGALTSMVIEYGLNVVSTQDTEETAHLLAMMIRQEQIGIPEISLIPKRKATTLPDMQRRVIEMLPGCGRVMARDLLQHFGSVERIVRATVAELRKVRGVGAKKARQIQQVLTAEYEALDTERQLEDAIEADHSLLFTQPVKLLARQHFIYDDEEDRHIVDLVFLDPRANELILVELKRGKLETDHREQLFRYLSHADESPLLRSYLEAGTAPRGILASPEPGKLKARRKNVTIEAVDTQRVIEVLKKLRRRRMKE